MAEPVIKPEEKPVETPKPDEDKDYNYAKDHNKDIRVIAKEGLDEKPEGQEPVVPAPEPKEEGETPAPEPKPTEPTASPLDEAKKYLEEQRKIDAESAKKIAEEQARETVKNELKRSRDEQDRDAKEKDELVPLWEKEGRAPKDYDEIAKENRRITKLELKIEARAEKEAEAKAAELKKPDEQPQAPVDATVDRIGREVEELFEGGYIPRPVKPGDPNDPGEKAKKALFEFGIKYNQDRVAAGKDPEPSIAKLYFLNAEKIRQSMKPKEVAGGDAPVSGSRPATVKQEDDGFVYARDHKKDFRTLAIEAARRKAS